MDDPFDLFAELNPSPGDVPHLENHSCPKLVRITTPQRKDAASAALLFENLRKDVPGLAISDFPRAFLIQVKVRQVAIDAGWRGSDEKTYQVFTMRAAQAHTKAVWPHMKVNFTEKPPVDLSDPYVKPGGWVDPDHYETNELQKWNYEDVVAKCAPGKEPSEYDLPNPRLYWLDGTQAYLNEPWWPHWIRGEFKRMVVDLFMDPKPLLFNTREPRLYKFLDHHKENGGNQPAFVEYVRELTVQPPPTFNSYLVDRMAYWVAKQPKRTKGQEPQLPLSHLFTSAEVYTKWLSLLRDEGHIDARGHWAKAKDAKGKRIVWLAFLVATETPSENATKHADRKGTKLKQLTKMFNTAIPGLDYAGRFDRLVKSDGDLKKDFLPKWSNKVNGK